MKNFFVISFLFSCLTCLAAQGKELDFGDGRSETLTRKAWDSYKAKKYDDAIGFVKECITSFEEQAVEMQKGLKEPVPTTDKEAVKSQWALNDVGTCYYILGQVLEKQDKSDKAHKAYNVLIEKFPYAQCWDTKGWFWKPADAAKRRVKVIEFERLENAEAE
jgi:tetratricopeptide (TPR) repeat protein